MFAIPDLSTGSEIISRIPLANPEQAITDLGRFLDSLLAAPPDDQAYFMLLERARVPIAFVAEELSKRYQNKPLPLGDIEDRFFLQVVSLWLKAARCYANCAERCSPDSESYQAARFAAFLHRCIHYTGMAILEHQRGRRELPWGLWLDLHGYYGSAEELRVATLAVPDVLGNQAHNTHCAAAYAGFLLFDMAGCYGLSLRDQAVVRRWAFSWSPLVSIHTVGPGKALPPFVVDLMQDVSLRPFSDCLNTDQIRCLDTSRLAIQLGHIQQQLRQRIPPSQLALGDDCTPGQCNRLLDHLSRHWSQARAPRKYRRRATSGISQISTGFEEMFYFVTGRKFQQPENVRIYSRNDFENLFAFRFQNNPQQALQIHKEQIATAYGIDKWEVVNQSANGFRLVRSNSGRKMAHGQLFALCPHDANRFLLARIVWLMQEKTGGLIAGIKALPGIPAGIAARIILEPSGAPADRCHPAFLLPPLAQTGAEQSLVLPQGWFRNGQIVELFAEGSWRVRLTHVLDSGPDFERVSFEIC